MVNCEWSIVKSEISGEVDILRPSDRRMMKVKRMHVRFYLRVAHCRIGLPKVQVSDTTMRNSSNDVKDKIIT
jgi:hypothetical protein